VLLVAATLGAVALAADPPADAGRGATVFTVKGCGRCHLPGARGPGMDGGRQG
jgi:hypothetical protein